MPQRYPQGRSAWILPSFWESGMPWDPTHHPTVISYLKGPHFSYNRTSDTSKLITPEPHDIPLTGTSIPAQENIYRTVKYIRPLLGESKELDSRRHFVISRDTVVVLALNFNPGPNLSLVFDALEIPLTRSVRHPADPKGRRLLSLRILLVDAVTETFVRFGKWDHAKVDEHTLAPSLVDFQAKSNIIDLRDGKAIMRFTLPCCFLDATHRTGHYKICIALRWEGQYVGLQILPGVFEVVHMGEDIPKITLRHRQRLVKYLHAVFRLLSRNSNSRTHYHSNCSSIIDGSFANALSLALGLVLNPIPIRNISASWDHQRLCSLSPVERRRLSNAIELEYDYIERILTRAHLDTAVLQRQYENATRLICPGPINWLPAELLIMVFFFIPDEHFDALGLTCRRWRDIALSMWSPLKLASWTPLDKAISTLHRSTGMLSVTIDPSSDATDRPTDLPETEQCRALMFAASTSISRWRTLDILSLPDPQQSKRFVGEHIPTTPMDRLRSLSIPIRHDSSHFLNLLLPSIGAAVSSQLTNIHLCSTQAMLYLSQPHCAHIFNHLTSFKCSFPRMNDIIDILPQFWRIETLELSGLHFPTYTANVELPLTRTLRRLSLRGMPIGWMNHREFLRLESCTVVSPPAVDTIPVTTLPLCKDLIFEGPRFDPIQGFRVPAISNLTLRSPQWGRSRGNDQLSRIWGPGLREGALRPVSLRLHLICSGEQLLRALCFMPNLKELVLELDRPTALGSSFFIALLSQSSRITLSHKRAGKGHVPLPVCPSLEVFGLKYRRWFRPGESNEMPGLVAMARLDERNQKVKIWVENGPDDHQKIQINYPDVSISDLCSLGLLRPTNGEQPSSRVRDVIEVSLAAFYSTGVKISDAETLTLLSPSVYSCLFRRLRDFSLNVDIDQRMLLEALGHFEQLEEMHLNRFMPPSSQPHLQLLRTLGRLRLDKTSSLWMEGCTFIKLGDLEIGEIEQESDGRCQCVQMVMCRSASLPQSIASELLGAFQMPQLRTLHLSRQPVGLRGLHYPTIQQFKLHAASLHFVDFGGLQTMLAMQPMLETLEIRGLIFPDFFLIQLPKLLDALIEPSTTNASDGLDNSNHREGSPMLVLPLCPKLKTLVLELKLGLRPWNHELAQELEEVRNMEQQTQQDWMQMQEWQPGRLRGTALAWELRRRRGLERKLERELQSLQVHRGRLETKLHLVSGEGWKPSAVRQCRTLMKRRLEKGKGCPLQRCQLALAQDTPPTEITVDSIGLPYLDMSEAEFLSLGDIFAIWQSRGL